MTIEIASSTFKRRISESRNNIDRIAEVWEGVMDDLRLASMQARETEGGKKKLEMSCGGHWTVLQCTLQEQKLFDRCAGAAMSRAHERGHRAPLCAVTVSCYTVRVCEHTQHKIEDKPT